MKLYLSNGDTYKLNLEAFLHNSPDESEHIELDFDECILQDGGLDYRTILKKGDIVTIADEEFQNIYDVRRVWNYKVKLRLI